MRAGGLMACPITAIPIMACPITDAGRDQKQDYYLEWPYLER